MADEESTKKPKRRPCAQTKKNVKRTTWYYREGTYFASKGAFKAWKKEKIEEQKKAEEEAKAKAEEEAKAAEAPAEATA